MMVDLGKYTVWVLSSYAVALSLLAAITLASIWQARRVKARLRAMEDGRIAAQAAAGATQPETGEAGNG